MNQKIESVTEVLTPKALFMKTTADRLAAIETAAKCVEDELKANDLSDTHQLDGYMCGNLLAGIKLLCSEGIGDIERLTGRC